MLIWQLALALLVFTWLALSPPAMGRILVIPLDGAAARALLPEAVGAGARPIVRGPIEGSLVVEGRHAAMANAFAGHRMMMLAAPRIACGDAA
ncbi:hypothetical protein [Sphingomonas baiyangensis]|uniref:Uncharacterized protein n=1 Tax=Sphingomonas baiyangensis TaxID=2572576 RepID=A0A4V5PW28_9SPHN|nr:hypothetical protein [Sphingomonas baiyangensis]TKD50078.1 hypothetical protein FBR43_04385 [Sphingomonas baiyangensis]